MNLYKILCAFVFLFLGQSCLAKIDDGGVFLGLHPIYVTTSQCVLRGDYSDCSHILDLKVELAEDIIEISIYKDGMLVLSETCKEPGEEFKLDLRLLGAGTYDLYVKDEMGLHYVRSIEVEEDSK